MSRTRDQDACPGALQVHQAADGALARVRLPGGMITAAQLDVLAETAARFGAGTLELTIRGNLQVRGITDTAAVADAVAAAGLLPSVTHERVRNIVASPLSGRVGGLADVRPWVAELDRAIQATPELTGLTGRFWFSIDDGSADVSGLAADAGVHVLPSGGQERSDSGINSGGQERSDSGINSGGQERSDSGINSGGQERSDSGINSGGQGRSDSGINSRVALLLAGRDTGVRLSSEQAVPALIAVARRFVETRGNAWRIAELDDPDSLLTGFTRSAPTGGRFPPGRPPVGWINQPATESDQARVALGAATPLGVLTARQAQFVAAVDAPVVITPWRSLLVCDLDEEVADTSLRVLAPLGLVFDETSRWLEVSACVGSPGCDRSRADVRAEARRVAESDANTGAVHYVGCERACGRPALGEVLVATDDGYRPLRTVG